MNATGLPIPTSGLPTALPAAAPAPATAAAPGDFLLMLGQLLGGAAAQNTGAAKSTLPNGAHSAWDAMESDTAETADGAAAMAMLPIASMVQWGVSWSNPQNLPSASEAAANAIGSLSLSMASGGTASRAGSMAKDAQLLTSLTDALHADDATASIQSNLSAQQSLDAAQGLRAVTGGEAAGTRALYHPVGSAAWADELGTRMTMMADRGQHSASLRLSPEHLGPLEVRIAIRDDQASVWFGAAHADTRAAIEQALPRLRELFASQGMSLADAGVFHEPPREQPRLSSALSSSPEAASAEAEAIAQVGPIRLGLVDAYA